MIMDYGIQWDGNKLSVGKWKQLARAFNIPKTNRRIQKKRLNKCINAALQALIEAYRDGHS